MDSRALLVGGDAERHPCWRIVLRYEEMLRLRRARGTVAPPACYVGVAPKRVFWSLFRPRIWRSERGLAARTLGREGFNFLASGRLAISSRRFRVEF